MPFSKMMSGYNQVIKGKPSPALTGKSKTCFFPLSIEGDGDEMSATSTSCMNITGFLIHY